MKLDGLWTVVFAKSEEDRANVVVAEEINRGGVLVLSGGRVYGGGISYFFVGDYNEQDGRIEMSITAKRYNDLVPGPFGGGTEARIEFRGNVSVDAMKLHGNVEGDPDARLLIVAERQHSID
jgi:hypothetical protein